MILRVGCRYDTVGADYWKGRCHMTLFVTLVLTHFVADWLFQTEYEAMNKAKGKFLNAAILKHSFIYTLAFVPALIYFGAPIGWLIALFTSHLFLDRRRPVVWWIKTVKRTSEETINKLFWMVIVIDQIFHILVLVPIAIWR